MGTLDDYAYQKRMEKTAKEQKAESKPRSSGNKGAGQSGGSGAGWSGGSEAAAARAREIQAQQEAARQRALEEAYRRQQEAAKRAKAEAAQRKLDEANAAERVQEQPKTTSDPHGLNWMSENAQNLTWGKPPRTLTPEEAQRARLDLAKTNPALADFYNNRAQQLHNKGFDTITNSDAAEKIQADQWANRIKYLTDAQLKASASDPGKITEAKQLDFDKMNVSDKGALMWNSMLDEALSGDRANLKKFGTDKNKDGVLQLSELKEGANIPKGYKAAYRSAFGNVDEDKIAFSPRVVGLLNTYGVDNVGLSLEQISQGAGYITDEDLVSNAKFKGDTGPISHITSRDEILMERLRPQLDEFTDMARNAQADVGGAKANLNLFDTTLEQRQEFIDSSALNLAQSEELLRTLRLGGRGNYTSDRFGKEGTGQDLSSLVGQSTMTKLNTMQQLRASIEAAGGDLDLKTDTQQKLSYLNSYGISADEWTDFLKEVRSSEKKNKSDATADELLGLKKEEGAK